MLSRRRMDTLDASAATSTQKDTKKRTKHALADVSGTTSKKNDRERECEY